MRNQPPQDKDQIKDLLTRILAVRLYSLGATQSDIAKAISKSKTWVNTLLSGIPKGKNK